MTILCVHHLKGFWILDIIRKPVCNVWLSKLKYLRFTSGVHPIFKINQHIQIRTTRFVPSTAWQNHHSRTQLLHLLQQSESRKPCLNPKPIFCSIHPILGWACGFGISSLSTGVTASVHTSSNVNIGTISINIHPPCTFAYQSFAFAFLLPIVPMSTPRQ